MVIVILFTILMLVLSVTGVVMSFVVKRAIRLMYVLRCLTSSLSPDVLQFDNSGVVWYNINMDYTKEELQVAFDKGFAAHEEGGIVCWEHGGYEGMDEYPLRYEWTRGYNYWSDVYPPGHSHHLEPRENES